MRLRNIKGSREVIGASDYVVHEEETESTKNPVKLRVCGLLEGFREYDKSVNDLPRHYLSKS